MIEWIRIQIITTQVLVLVRGAARSKQCNMDRTTNNWRDLIRTSWQIFHFLKKKQFCSVETGFPEVTRNFRSDGGRLVPEFWRLCRMSIDHTPPCICIHGNHDSSWMHGSLYARMEEIHGPYCSASCFGNSASVQISRYVWPSVFNTCFCWRDAFSFKNWYGLDNLKRSLVKEHNLQVL